MKNGHVCGSFIDVAADEFVSKADNADSDTNALFTKLTALTFIDPLDLINHARWLIE